MTEIKRPEYYNAKYKAGGWNYNPDNHRQWLKNHIVERFGLQAGMQLLEIGCGMGLHSALLSEFGLNVSGIDASIEGIRAAISRGSKAKFICDTASNMGDHFEPERFDVIFVRGMSWYHYELDQVSRRTGVDVREKTGEFFRFLKPGGLFILQIKTNFSGDAPRDAVHENRLGSYLQLFEPLGTIEHVSNWQGVDLYSQEQAEQIKGGILIATRKG